MGDPGQLIVDVLGTAVALRAPASVLIELRAVLVDLEPGHAPERHLVIEAQADGRFRLLDSETAAHPDIATDLAAATMVWRLNAIASATTSYLVIHAGCVAGPGAVLLPGRSGTGKSTLVAACVTAGMAYLSDEYAAIDLHRGTLAPYPKPIGLDGNRLVAASGLRPGSVAASLPPAGIVFPHYERGEETSVTRLDPGWTLLALAAHCTNLAKLGETALTWLAGLATACPGWQIAYADAGDAVSIVEAAAATPVAEVRAAALLGPITPTTTTVAVGDDLAVLDTSTGQIHLLNETASFVWTCVPDAPDPLRLADAALARAPAGSLDPAGVTATVEHLTQSGLLPESSS